MTVPPDALPQEDSAAPTPLRLGAMFFVIALTLIAIVYLRWRGRIWWCACGSFNPISLVVASQQNSQHLFDPYSLSHVLHGVFFFGVLWLFRRRLTLPIRAAVAATIEIAWEMLENSPIIIDRYRAATVSLGYTGDAILNSIADILSFILGFYVARKLGLWRSVAIFVVVELLMLWLMRDNLTLNVLMLLWPIDAIKNWQAAG